MSKKNLKVYRTVFVTEVGSMQFKVKFPCQVKMIWKRSSESAETTLVPVENGVVHFNQTLKLNVNMYFDPESSTFTEKKCLYSFLLVTEKGEKSAGSVSYDLGAFLNKRMNEIEEDFPLQKCPLPDTKVHLKISYNQSKEQGYDTMSQISAADQSVDMSMTQADASDLGTGCEDEKKSQTSATDQGGSEQKQQEGEQNIELLNDSAFGVKVEQEGDKSYRLTENIQALSDLSQKINDFTIRCSGNIKNQLDNVRHMNQTLTEALAAEKCEKQKIQVENQKNKQKVNEIQRQLQDFKNQAEAQIQCQRDKNTELEEKLKNSEKLCQQFETNLDESSDNKGQYIKQLKGGFEETENRLKAKIQELNEQVLIEKKQHNQLQEMQKNLTLKLEEFSRLYEQEKEKNQILERKEANREKQLTDVRYKLQTVYENLVSSMGNILK